MASGTAELEDDEAAIDRFLGRLRPALNIHERTCRIMSRPESRPSTIHRDLLRLFGSLGAVRLVTTNFDDHFLAAAKDLWDGGTPEYFAAPAVPLGRDFHGLVHLHGSATLDAGRLVLTDEDFGRAYLTDGWARRFLQAMFSSYTVLFVGYSHRDPIMHYLTRGMPNLKDGNRFALTADGDEGFWKGLGVLPLAYPLQPDGQHGRVQEAVARWASFANEDPLDQRGRIREIVAEGPPGPGEDNDYLVAGLDRESTVRHFVEFAEGAEWFEWAKDQSCVWPRFLPLVEDMTT